LTEEVVDEWCKPGETRIGSKPVARAVATLPVASDHDHLACLRRDDPDDHHAPVEVPVCFRAQGALVLVAPHDLDGQQGRLEPKTRPRGRLGAPPYRHVGAARVLTEPNTGLVRR